MTEAERAKASFGLYQVAVPGTAHTRTVVAASLKRALELAIEPQDEVHAGEMVAVWNVTAGWICHSPQASQSTWSLLKERREGRVFYDYQEGWQRLEF